LAEHSRSQADLELVNNKGGRASDHNICGSYRAKIVTIILALNLIYSFDFLNNAV
jgi:hypothetical protein